MTPEETSNSIEYVWNRPWPWSVWLTVALGLALVAGIVAIYWYERGQASKVRRGILAALRIAAVLLVTWMLAGWSIERYQSDRPELVLLIDESASMQTTDAVGSSTQRNSESRWDAATRLLRRAWTVEGSRVDRQYRPKLYAVAMSFGP